MRRTGLLVVAILLGDRAALAQVPGTSALPSSFSTPAVVSPSQAPQVVPGQAMLALPAEGSPPAGAPQTAGTAKPTEEVVENIRSFDHMSATMTWVNKHWQVMVDGTVLKDFG